MSAPVLIASGIHMRFDEFQVLKGISVEAHEGDVISILGLSGFGKSTVLRGINFLEAPDHARAR